MENVCGIRAVEMAGVLGSKNVQHYLIIDCRSFLSFNQGRILESINIHCPPILKRRSGGFISLENIVPCELKRSLLLSGVLTNVLVYDENTEDLTQVPKDSNLLSVIKSLLQQISNVTVRYVIGGFEALREECPALCVEQVMTHTNRERACRDGSARTVFNCNTTSSFREPAEILPYLYLGDESHSSQRAVLDRLSITALVNVSSQCHNHFEDHYRYMNIHIDDSLNADLASWFPALITFIDEVAATGGKVLVHCWAGISRSATVCIAYIMQQQRASLEKAFDFVLARRSVIDPNLNFIQQLQRFETQCLQQPPPPPPSPQQQQHQHHHHHPRHQQQQQPDQGSQTIQRHHQLQFPSSSSSSSSLSSTSTLSAHHHHHYAHQHHIPPPSPRPMFPAPGNTTSSSVFSFSPVSPTPPQYPSTTTALSSTSSSSSLSSSTHVLSRLTSLVPYNNSDNNNDNANTMITLSQIRRHSSSGVITRSENNNITSMSSNSSSSSSSAAAVAAAAEKQQDLSPSSLSQTAASPNPLRVAPSRPNTLPILQLNASSFPNHHHRHPHPYHLPQQQHPHHQQHQYSLSPLGLTSHQGTELMIGTAHQTIPTGASNGNSSNSNTNNTRLSPLSPMFDFTTHQPEDDVAVAMPMPVVSSQASAGAPGSFDFFPHEASTSACCPPVTLPSPHHPTACTTAASHDAPVVCVNSLNPMGFHQPVGVGIGVGVENKVPPVTSPAAFPSPISPRPVPRSPLSPVPSFG